MLADDLKSKSHEEYDRINLRYVDAERSMY